MRECGILMPVFSLPSKYGIGSFSKEAYEFVDMLAEAKQTYWQILPLGPTGYGDSPYQSFSSFAGNPYFIDLDALFGEGLLTKAECEQYEKECLEKCGNKIHYDFLFETRFQILHKAFERFSQGSKEFLEFVEEEKEWLYGYSQFMAIKEAFGQKPFWEWDESVRLRNKYALDSLSDSLKEEISFWQFLQYQFFKQWNRLHQYAKEKGIKIIGDIPIYVAYDSADCWLNPELFQFNELLEPIRVAGCPPDAFSEEGQLWGNPLYDWTYHEKTGFAWWTKRMQHCFQMYDVVRIDHFRGFDEYYAIPFGKQTAVEGKWMKGPGVDLFLALQKSLGPMPIIAEDLGFLTDSVEKLLKLCGYPGMKVLQFAFDSREESNYLPHTYSGHCVVYTGTHDNDTIKGWFSSLSKEDAEYAKEYLGHIEEDVSWSFIRLAMASVAKICIIPIQDYLSEGSEGRINVPSTLGENWCYRIKKPILSKSILKKIADMTSLYGRERNS